MDPAEFMPLAFMNDVPEVQDQLRQEIMGQVDDGDTGIWMGLMTNDEANDSSTELSTEELNVLEELSQDAPRSLQAGSTDQASTPNPSTEIGTEERNTLDELSLNASISPQAGSSDQDSAPLTPFSQGNGPNQFGTPLSSPPESERKVRIKREPQSSSNSSSGRSLKRSRDDSEIDDHGTKAPKNASLHQLSSIHQSLPPSPTLDNESISKKADEAIAAAENCRDVNAVLNETYRAYADHKPDQTLEQPTEMQGKSCIDEDTDKTTGENQSSVAAGPAKSADNGHTAKRARGKPRRSRTSRAQPPQESQRPVLRNHSPVSAEQVPAWKYYIDHPQNRDEGTKLQQRPLNLGIGQTASTGNASFFHAGNTGEPLSIPFLHEVAAYRGPRNGSPFDFQGDPPNNDQYGGFPIQTTTYYTGPTPSSGMPGPPIVYNAGAMMNHGGLFGAPNVYNTGALVNHDGTLGAFSIHNAGAPTNNGGVHRPPNAYNAGPPENVGVEQWNPIPADTNNTGPPANGGVGHWNPVPTSLYNARSPTIGGVGQPNTGL